MSERLDDRTDFLTFYRKVTRKRNRQELESERSARLETALQRLGLKRRGDSTLCEGYIEGKIECYWTADAVAEKMAQMKVSLPILAHRCTNADFFLLQSTFTNIPEVHMFDE